MEKYVIFEHTGHFSSSFLSDYDEILESLIWRAGVWPGLKMAAL